MVENRLGAAYAIAAVAVAKAAPDGYTLIASELEMFTCQHHLCQQDKRPFDGERDFVPVSDFDEIPVALVSHPGFGVKAIGELIAQAKARPGMITYDTAGPARRRISPRCCWKAWRESSFPRSIIAASLPR